ncbi:MAG: DUF4390 domain-containing protein [Burkholderiales bacterium]|nr:DUF4390 domain-containing protein [Burkholderiales bacterium]
MHPPLVRRHDTQGLLQALRLALVCLLLLLAQRVPAQGVELASLHASRAEGALNLEFSARVSLPRTVEEALQRGVPLYFVADAELFRKRWYWRDERVARVTRSWRVAYQPLTGNWRVGLGGLNQTFATLGEALTSASRSASWKLADLSQLDLDKSYYIEFSYKLDTSQLPGPMQFGLNGLTGQGDWAVGVSRVFKVELGTSP